ncbi:hypothetical protein [Mycolicibacterium hodleri]|nr:hypothetical protein [Mycolicibacterium hodleri]
MTSRIADSPECPTGSSNSAMQIATGSAMYPPSTTEGTDISPPLHSG